MPPFTTQSLPESSLPESTFECPEDEDEEDDEDDEEDDELEEEEEEKLEDFL